MKRFLASLLLLMAILSFAAAFQPGLSWFARLLMIVIALDLVGTIFWKPLIGRGPIAKALFTDPED